MKESFQPSPGKLRRPEDTSWKEHEFAGEYGDRKDITDEELQNDAHLCHYVLEGMQERISVLKNEIIELADAGYEAQDGEAFLATQEKIKENQQIIQALEQDREKLTSFLEENN
jgi:hypothetical protein